MGEDRLLAERLKLQKEVGSPHPFAVTEYTVYKIKKEEVKNVKG